MTSSSGLGSFFILRRRGVEQHGRPTVRTMIWTNNPLDESGRCLCFTETAAWCIIFDYFLSRGTPGKILLWPTFFWLRSWLQSTRQKQTVPGSIWQYPINADNKKSTKHRFSIDISWILLGASSDTELSKNHRSTICFWGHRIATCLYRTPMGSCVWNPVAFYIPHNLKIIKYAQRSLLPSPGANERCFFCLQRKEASVKWQFFG